MSKILIIDDSALSRSMLREILELSMVPYYLEKAKNLQQMIPIHHALPYF